MDEPLRILMVGPMPPPITGSKITFALLAEAIEGEGQAQVALLSTTRPNAEHWWADVRAAVRVIRQVLRLGRWAQVISFHASLRAMVVAGPLLYVVSTLLRRPLVARLFGGRYDMSRVRLGRLLAPLARRTVLRSAAFLVETKDLVRDVTAEGARRVEWFSNYTRMPIEQAVAASAAATEAPAEASRHPAGQGCTRYAFVGRVTPEKGIDVLLEAAALLDDGVTVDVYGPLSPAYTADKIDRAGAGRVAYRGVVLPERVSEVLAGYDALVLPTYYPTEGYPAVVLEAYARGLPVVASRWRAIPEIVDDRSGVLVPPRDAQSLAQALNRLRDDAGLYAALRRGALERRGDFAAEPWARRFVEICRSVARG